MKASEITAAVKLATTEGANVPGYFSEEMAAFDGYGVDRQKRYVTLAQVASLIRGEAINLRGDILSDELQNICRVARHYFYCVG